MANCTALSVSSREKKPSCSLKFSITSNSKIKVCAEIPSALILCCGSPNPKPPTQWTIRMLFHGTALYLGRKELGCEVGAAEVGGVREVRAFPVKQGEVTLKSSSSGRAGRWHCISSSRSVPEQQGPPSARCPLLPGPLLTREWWTAQSTPQPTGWLRVRCFPMLLSHRCENSWGISPSGDLSVQTPWGTNDKTVDI